MQFLDEETETIKTSLSNVSGGLKVLNFGGIKMPTSTAFGFKVNSSLDAEIGSLKENRLKQVSWMITRGSFLF
jgi:hypothetical protein